MDSGVLARLLHPRSLPSFPSIQGLSTAPVGPLGLGCPRQGPHGGVTPLPLPELQGAL